MIKMGVIHDSRGNSIDKSNPLQVGSSATGAIAGVPNDSTTFSPTKGLYVGVSGDVAVTMENGQDVTFVGLAAGIIHPISVIKVKATGTTATSIVAVY